MWLEGHKLSNNKDRGEPLSLLLAITKIEGSRLITPPMWLPSNHIGGVMVYLSLLLISL